MKDLNEITLQEFLEMPSKKPDRPFTSVVIVPTDEIHESGFRCMKFILAFNGEIVGVVYTCSDVVWPNGIGNRGKYWTAENFERVPYTGLHIDCLAESRCVRIIVDKPCVLDDFIGSDFIFYTVDE